MRNKQRMWQRRHVLLGLGALGGAVPLALANKFQQQVQAFGNSDRDFSVTGNATLSDRAASKGLIYGAFLEGGYKSLSESQQLRSLLQQQCNLIVGGFYWVESRPTQEEFNFAPTDAFATFASENQLLFRGHPLIWHQANPDWLEEKFKNPNTTTQEIQNILTNHLSTVVKRYAGKIHSWDVLNEAVEPSDGRSDGLRQTPWLKFLGSDYIEQAFRIAAEHDPKALLVYNDYALEYDVPEEEAKREAVLKLLERLKSQGTPIHALGIQSHLSASKHQNFNPQKLQSFIKDVASLGLKILITELDVADDQLPLDIEKRDRLVAGVYEDYLSAVLSEKAVIAVVTWGLSDRYTWLSEASPRPDKQPVRPLPYDTNFVPKVSWNAIARAFETAPQR